MSLPAPDARALAQSKKRSDLERQRRRASRALLFGPDFNINNATPDQLYQLESADTGAGTSGLLPDADKRRRRALAALALRKGQQPKGRVTGDLIDGRTGEVRADVDPTVAAMLRKRVKTQRRTPGRPYIG